jgi:hypothetical protein
MTRQVGRFSLRVLPRGFVFGLWIGFDPMGFEIFFLCFGVVICSPLFMRCHATNQALEEGTPK